MHLLENAIFKAKASVQIHWFSPSLMKCASQLQIKTRAYLNKLMCLGSCTFNFWQASINISTLSPLHGLVSPNCAVMRSSACTAASQCLDQAPTGRGVTDALGSSRAASRPGGMFGTRVSSSTYDHEVVVESLSLVLHNFAQLGARRLPLSHLIVFAGVWNGLKHGGWRRGQPRGHWCH